MDQDVHQTAVQAATSKAGAMIPTLLQYANAQSDVTHEDEDEAGEFDEEIDETHGLGGAEGGESAQPSQDDCVAESQVSQSEEWQDYQDYEDDDADVDPATTAALIERYTMAIGT